MEYDLALLTADIRDELDNIRRLMEDFDDAWSRLPNDDDPVPFYDRSAIGYYIHSFYTGCENIFRSIASGIRTSSSG